MNMISAYKWKTLDDVRKLATLYHDSVWDKESSLGMQWLDKPHRNIYDLVYLVRQLADKLEESGLPETPDYSSCPNIKMPMDCSFQLSYGGPDLERPWRWTFIARPEFPVPKCNSQQNFATMSEAMSDLQDFVNHHYPKS